jgi:hypothetical protein
VAPLTPCGFGQSHHRGQGSGQLIRRLAAVPAFFLFRLGAGVLLLKLSASGLPVGGFTVLSQLLLFAALVNSMAVGGVQNALVRQSAAAADHDALVRGGHAALSIWCGACALLAPAIALGAGAISHMLIGSDAARHSVLAIGLAALVAGPGQIWCSMLTGRGHPGQSLLAQGAGLAAGTLGAVWFIRHGAPQGAAVAFACGPLVAMAAAALGVRRLRLPLPRPLAWGPEIVTLLRYSAAYTATASYGAGVLFVLRWYYRAHFGSVALGYWLAANRISDLSTQLLGLAMVQLFVPHIAVSQNHDERRRLLLRYGLAGVAVMGTGALTFSLAARPLVHIFLSDAYLAAIPAIRIYMVGDMLRVWTLLAMYDAFARGQPVRYALVEMAAYTVMLMLVPLLGATAGQQAPFLGYLSSFAIMAAGVTGLFLAGSRRNARHAPHRWPDPA